MTPDVIPNGASKDAQLRNRENIHLRIYHTSDLHNHRGFAPRLNALREEKPGHYFDCGDSLRGSQTAYHRDEPIIRELDAANCEAQAIGNREYHYLFNLLRAREKKMHHPLVCTNLIDTKNRQLPFLRSLVLPLCHPEEQPQVASRRAVSLHILGLLIMQYPIGSPWEHIFGWRFLQPWDVVAEYAKTIPSGDMLLVLSHIGLTLDRKLAQQVPRIDLILGGHSHDTLFEPEIVNDVPIVHAGPYGKYVSRTELAYDAQRVKFAIDDFALVPLLENAGV